MKLTEDEAVWYECYDAVLAATHSNVEACRAASDAIYGLCLPGSGVPVHECSCDGNGVTHCPTCDRFVLTLELQGQWRYVVAHAPLHVAVVAP